MIVLRKFLSSFPLPLLAAAVVFAFAGKAVAAQAPVTFPQDWVVEEEIDEDGDPSWSAYPGDRKNSDDVEIFVMQVKLDLDSDGIQQEIIQIALKTFLKELEKATKALKNLDKNAKFVCENLKPVQVNSASGAATACNFEASSPNDRFKVELVAVAGEKYLFLTYYMADAPLYQNYLQHWKAVSASLKVQ